MKNYKVLITTSGVGSRLGELTSYTNKCLIRVGKKPAISYIIESYPNDTKFVITLGYYGKHVKDFLELAYENLEPQTIARACGKSHVNNLEPEDLVALTVEAAAMAQVPLSGTDWIPGRNNC